MIPQNIEVIDAHTHFFSYHWLQHFYELTKEQFTDGVRGLAKKLNWELPPQDPRELGKRWVQEQDKFGVKKQVLFASKLNDAELLTVAVQAYPERLIGYVMIDPSAPEGRNQAHYSLNILSMKGILLFPALHHFHAGDEMVYSIYEEAASAEVPVFIHFGQLNIPIYQKLGIPNPVDLGYSNPRDLVSPAKEFPEINFIIPHFGCGRFAEALEVAGQFKNVYFDTSSSNSWIQPPLTLEGAYKKSLEVLGPERLLFGTDSSFFPRGWRKDIFDVQWKILDSLHLSVEHRKLVFGGNLVRILSLD